VGGRVGVICAGAVQVQRDVPLAARTTLGVGGPASYFVEAHHEALVIEALQWSARRQLQCRILGGGSNVVVSDAGFNGLVVQLATRGVSVRPTADGVELVAAAGEPWDELVARTVAQGWAGLECLSGIPGSVGATPIQNVGAYGQEVSSCISRVRVFDRNQRELVELSAGTCRFGYRDSLFKSVDPERYVVLGVNFRLRAHATPEVRHRELQQHLSSRELPSLTPAAVRESVLELRRTKSMLLAADDPNSRSCGSFFVNPLVDRGVLAAIQVGLSPATVPHWVQPDGRVKLSAGWLVEQAGFARGYRAGTAGLSSRHALALVCHGAARASDVVTLARRIRATVQERFGVRLQPEPAFWGFGYLDDGLPHDRSP
jgi:UDP-N-acetylmuramate dehydrogenase